MIHRTKMFSMLALSVVAGASFAQEAKVVKIGFSSPLSGSQASAGKDNQGGLQMAVERLNAQGVTVAGKKVRFELLAEDDQADPRSGVTVAQKLVDAGVKAIIGPYNSGVTIPASKIYNDAGIVMATVASNPKVTEQGFSYVFRVAASDSQLGGKMAAYAAKELKMKRIIIVDDRTAYGQGLGNEFEKIAKANGIQIVGREYTNDKASDFMAILTSAKAKHPDAIFYGGYAPQGAAMARQMKQINLNTMLLGGDGICSAEMGRLSGDAVGPHIYCTQGGSILEKGDAGKTFVADYKQKYNRAPEVYAASFYDGMMLVAQAMKAANSVEPKQYAPELAKIKYKGVAASYDFDEKHNLKQSPVTIFQFKDGEPTAIANY